jgi:hypothetical protein
VPRTLFEQSDGCSAQYTSGTAIFCAIMIANRYGITVNKMITCPQHGKDTVDGISGGDKHYAQTHFLTANIKNKGIDNFTIDAAGIEVDPAVVIAKLLNSPSRVQGLKGLKRSKKRQQQQTHDQERHYRVIDWNEMNMPIPTTTFVVKAGLPKKEYYPPDIHGKKKVRPYGDVSDHFQVYADWRIPGHSQCALRQIPCHCTPCYEQLNMPWDDRIKDEDWATQMWFERAPIVF